MRLNLTTEQHVEGHPQDTKSGIFHAKNPHTHTHLRLGLFGIQIASHRVCVLNVLPASGDMNYSKKQQQKMWQGVAFRDKGVGQRGKGGVNNFSLPPRTNILKRCAAYKRGQRSFPI